MPRWRFRCRYFLANHLSSLWLLFLYQTLWWTLTLLLPTSHKLCPRQLLTAQLWLPLSTKESFIVTHASWKQQILMNTIIICATSIRILCIDALFVARVLWTSISYVSTSHNTNADIIARCAHVNLAKRQVWIITWGHILERPHINVHIVRNGLSPMHQGTGISNMYTKNWLGPILNLKNRLTHFSGRTHRGFIPLVLIVRSLKPYAPWNWHISMYT